MSEIVMIGAGIAGLTAARELKNAGYNLRILEKSRGLGGRSATRRVAETAFDHGAQYFTVRDERFKTQVEAWLEQKQVEVWTHGFHRWKGGKLEPPGQGHPRYSCPAGMARLGKLLAEGLEVESQTRIASVERIGETWSLKTDEGLTLETAQLIINAPAAQAKALCAFALEPEVAQALDAVEMAPCFALAAAFPREFAPDWQAIQITEGPLAWLAHDSSKRATAKETVLMLHSTHAFARAAFDEAPEKVKGLMLEQLKSIDDRYISALWTSFQRWRYAKVMQPYKATCLDQKNLYFCGDWCGGDTVEAAYLSGLATADRLMAQLDVQN